MTTTLRALAYGVAMRRWRIAVATTAVFAVYQGVIAGILTVGLGGLPTYLRLHPAWANARRIVAMTPSWPDIVTLLAREPLLEYGRRHPTFGVAVWSYELTWSSLLFYLSFSLLVGIYLALDATPRGWGAVGSLGGAGLVGLVGASVSSLTHCGLGSVGILLALAGVSTATIVWSGWLGPVLIPAGYGLMIAAIVGRAARLGSAEASGVLASELVRVSARGVA